MLSDSEAGAWGEHDPFGEDFYIVPHAEEIWVRSEQLAEQNQDAFRYFVESVIWRALDLDDRDHLKDLLSLLWLWEDVDPRWLAEASYRSVGDVRDLVDSEPVMIFNCLFCGVELKPMNRLHQVRMRQSHKAYRRNGGDPPMICSARRASHRGPITPKINVAWMIFVSKPSLPNIAGSPMRSADKQRSGQFLRNRYIVVTAIAAACVVARTLSYISITAPTIISLKSGLRI
jgi:hypothetical protein